MTYRDRILSAYPVINGRDRFSAGCCAGHRNAMHAAAEIAAEADAEIDRLRAALYDIACSRGMFGVDPAQDAAWASSHARDALNGGAE